MTIRMKYFYKMKFSHLFAYFKQNISYGDLGIILNNLFRLLFVLVKHIMQNVDNALVSLFLYT